LTLGVLAAVAASSSNTDDVAPGVLGFLVFAAMAVALVFLLRSMNKQFRKITPPAEGAPPAEGDSAQSQASDSAPATSAQRPS
jgi:hypothetical protein